MAVASVWLTWCRRRRSRAIDNWTADVARETPPGRIRVATWPEIAALVAAAEKLGRPRSATPWCWPSTCRGRRPTSWP
jgi:hypothetical protein